MPLARTTVSAMLRRAGLAAIVVSILSSCGGGGGVSAPPTTPQTTVEVTTATTVAPTTDAPTTTEAPTGSKSKLNCFPGENFDDDDGDGWGECVPAPTTTEEMSQDIAILLIGSNIDSDQDFRDLLSEVATDADYSVESVDLIEFETTDGGVANFRLAVTAGYSTQEILDEIAWNIAREFAFLWEASDDDEIFRNDDGVVKVGFVLTVDASTYAASYDHMVAVADMRMISADWIAATRM